MKIMYEKNLKNYVYVCPCCFNKPEGCTCSVLPFTLLQLDKNMWPIIKVLNEKGYYTDECCEGHVNSNERMYIFFRKRYKNKSPLPNGFQGDASFLAADITGCSEDAKRRKKRQLLNSLYEWADSLEKR